jgi:hypothetical protein
VLFVVVFVVSCFVVLFCVVCCCFVCFVVCWCYVAIMQHFSDCDGSAIFRISSTQIAICTNSYQHRMQFDLFQTSSKFWLTCVGVHVLRVLSKVTKCCLINCINSSSTSTTSALLVVLVIAICKWVLCILKLRCATATLRSLMGAFLRPADKGIRTGVPHLASSHKAISSSTILIKLQCIWPCLKLSFIRKMQVDLHSREGGMASSPCKRTPLAWRKGG